MWDSSGAKLFTCQTEWLGEFALIGPPIQIGSSCVHVQLGEQVCTDPSTQCDVQSLQISVVWGDAIRDLVQEDRLSLALVRTPVACWSTRPEQLSVLVYFGLETGLQRLLAPRLGVGQVSHIRIGNDHSPENVPSTMQAKPLELMEAALCSAREVAARVEVHHDEVSLNAPAMELSFGGVEPLGNLRLTWFCGPSAKNTIACHQIGPNTRTRHGIKPLHCIGCLPGLCTIADAAIECHSSWVQPLGMRIHAYASRNIGSHRQGRNVGGNLSSHHSTFGGDANEDEDLRALAGHRLQNECNQTVQRSNVGRSRE